MKWFARIGLAVLPLLPFVGCVAVKVSQPEKDEMVQTSQTRSVCQSEVSGVEPTLESTDDTVNVSLSLLGSFDIETRTVFASSAVWDEFMAVGFFPGVMSCKGEYRDCLPNASGAVLYNIVFVGLPTVYGLLIEPWVPHYPQQTDSIVGQRAFLKSALIGFSRYAKPAEAHERQSASHSETHKIRLDDAVVVASELGLESERGKPLRIPVDSLPGSGEIKVKFRLPAEHPLKSSLSGFEEAEITIQCANKQ